MRYVTTLFRNPQGFLNRKFDPTWVDKLARNLRRWDETAELVVLTHFDPSDFTEPVEVIPLMHPERDWSTMMECLRPEAIGERAVVIGLDTLALGPLGPLWDRWDSEAHPFIAPPCRIDPLNWGNGVVGITSGTAAEVWSCWVLEREAAMRDKQFGLFGKFSELEWMRRRTRRPENMHEIIGKEISQWTPQMAGIGHPPDHVRLLYFAGPLKQDSLVDQKRWVKENWA